MALPCAALSLYNFEDLVATHTLPLYLYICDVSQQTLDSPGFLEKAKEILMPPEYAEAMRFHFESDKVMALTSRILQRLLLGTYSGCSPVAVQIRRKFGKPHWVHSNQLTPRIHFNVSHDHGVVCIVASRYLVGVDCMKQAIKNPMRSQAEFFDTMSNIFSKKEWQFIHMTQSGNEQSILKGKNGPLQLIHFMKLWTMKESFIKAIGAGLGIEPSRLECSIDSQTDLTLRTRFFLDAREVKNFAFKTLSYDDKFTITVCAALECLNEELLKGWISKGLPCEANVYDLFNHALRMELQVIVQTFDINEIIETTLTSQNG